MEAAVHAPVARKPSHPMVTADGLKQAASNCLLAAMFFIAAIPAGKEMSWSVAGLANVIWIAGAITMGLFSLMRAAPRSTAINFSTIVATGGMLVLPALMRPLGASPGALGAVGIALELVGVVLTQVSRIYMGRSFGLFPANRGIVSRGPFASVRHPIYAGWIILSIGYAMSYPSARNVMLIAATLPLMVWRIEQEEAHLKSDPAYLSYLAKVRFRLIPGVI